MNPVTIPPDMSVRRVILREHPVNELASSVRIDYERKFGQPPQEPGGWYHADDWHRVSYVIEMLRPGGRFLDVGCGAGQFLNMVARAGRFESVTGIDKARFKKYTEFEPDVSKSDGDIGSLQFDDDSFDVVTCMEVLEHVPDEVFLGGIEELRRVCRGQLIMSVPFCEPEPISRTHVRRFEVDDIRALFPDARLTLLDRPRMPWMVMEERFGATKGSWAAAAIRDDSDPRDATIARLRSEVEALRNRKSIRLANFVGRTVRGLENRIRG